MDLMARFVRGKRTKAYIRSPVRLWGFTRENLADVLNEELPRLHGRSWLKGAEIGVQKGKFAEVLCRAISELSLTAVDPWREYGQDEYVLSDEDHAEGEAQARARLAAYDVTFKTEPSAVAVQTISPESLDFVYIDGNHTFDYVMHDLIEWSKRVRPGGIVAGHDYYEWNQGQTPEQAGGVVAAVQAYTTAHAIDPWFVTDEPCPSYLWVKR